MGLLTDIAESLKEESMMKIEYKILKNEVVFKVLDSFNKPLKDVVLSVKNKRLGKTNEKGVLKVEKSFIPRSGIVKASSGVYSNSLRF